jgi:N4-gp56 family major capsid protein
MTWALDAPSGVYKNHALSSEIRREAMFDTQTMQFLRPEPGFGKRRGDTITITRFMQLPVAGRVGEQDALPQGRPAVNTKALTVGEWGFKVPVTEFEENLTSFDLTNYIQQMLRDQMSLTMDLMATSALNTTQYLYTPEVGGGAFSTTGTAAGLATANLAISDLRLIRDQLRKNKAPYFRSGKYIGILGTRAARGIKNDPEYKDWSAPMSDRPMISGLLKPDVEGFELYETNNAYSFPDLIGASTVTGSGMFFGSDPGFLAIVASPELRAGLPMELGRFREVGWVGTIDASITWDQPTLSRVIALAST